MDMEPRAKNHTPMEGDGDALTVIDAALANYRDIRQQQSKAKVCSRYFWAREGKEKEKLLQSLGEENGRFREYVGRGTRSLQTCLEERRLTSAAAAGRREQLLLRAARSGYVHLVVELLRPSGAHDGSTSPVSTNAIDENGNTIIHLAVLSKSVALVTWILGYLRKNEKRGTRSWWELLNNQHDTAMSLAVRTGKMRMINCLWRSQKSLGYYLANWGPELFKRMDLEAVWENVRHHSISWTELDLQIDNWRKDTKEKNNFFLCHLNASITFLQARLEANGVVQEAVDALCRSQQLQSMNWAPTEHGLGLANLKGKFGGILAPWWDPNLSSFNLERYVAKRSKEELESWFNLLNKTIEGGHNDSPLWLLDYFKAPPSLMSIQGKNYYDLDWYFQEATKPMQRAIIGWTAETALAFLKHEKEKAYLHSGCVDRVVAKMLGSEGGGNSSTLHSLRRNEWQAEFREDDRWDMDRAWQKIQESTPENYQSYGEWFGTEPRELSAMKRACSSPVESFETSEQAKLLSFFFEKSYKEDPNFLSVDLPNLAHFVALDHLPLFRFLTKERSSTEPPFVDLDLPLFCPQIQTVDSSESTMNLDGGEAENQCPICLETMEKPYVLECGHSFHHQCLFHYVFPSLRDVGSDDADRQAHKILASMPHLSFKLGSTNCPYCRQAVKPTLSQAFALNLADGLKRIRSERRNHLCSPHLDLQRGSIGITVGETLLAFAACAGAINIFQWLVLDIGIKPDHVRAANVNVLHHAISHNQVLIFRWLLEHGYSNMLYGNMQRESFDTFFPTLEPGTTMADLCAFLEDAENLENIKIWNKETQLLQLSGRDNYDYTAKEKEVLGQPMCRHTVQILSCKFKIRRKSPIHHLLIEGMEDLSGGYSNQFFYFLRSKGISAVPENWNQLSLAFSLDFTMRAEAKAFGAQKVLSVPSRIVGQSLKHVFAVSRTWSFDEVLVPRPLDQLSPLVVTTTVEDYNLWELLLREESNWIQFLQIAMSLDVFAPSATYDWFDNNTDAALKQVDAFIEALIICGRVDVLAAFTKTESFCDSQNTCGRVDIFSRKERLYGGKVALRPLVSTLGKTEAFRQFFEHIDRVKKVVDDSHFLFDNVVEAIHGGKSLDEIRSNVDILRREAEQLPRIEMPLGIGSNDDIIARLNLSSINWLINNCRTCIGNKMEHALGIIAEKEDTEILQWVFSLAAEGERDRIESDGGEDFMRRVLNPIVKTCSIFAIEGFISFCSESNYLPRYKNRKDLLMEDLLNGGILGNIIGDVMDLHVTLCCYTTALPNNINLLKTEAMFTMLNRVLNQKEVIMHLSCEEKREKCLSDIFGEGDVTYNAFLCPHVTFRVLELLRSKGFNLAAKVGGGNLIYRFFEMESSRYCEYKSIVPGELVAANAYKDENGKEIKSKVDLIRWLALSVGVSMQHLRYQDVIDLKDRGGYRERELFMSKKEFDALKREQDAVIRAAR